MKKTLVLIVALTVLSVGAFANGVIGGLNWQLVPGAPLALTLGYEGDGWATLVTKDDFSTWVGTYGIDAVYVPYFSDNAYGRFGVDLIFDWEDGEMPVYQNLALVAGFGYGIPIGGGAFTARGGLTFYISSSWIRPVINVELFFSPAGSE